MDSLEFLDSGPGPSACVVALHGRGVTGEDLAPMAEELALPGLRWIFPHGPLPFAPIPGGREWFSLEGASLSSWKTPVDDPKLGSLFSGLNSAKSLLTALLDRIWSQGLRPERTALLGFSQGAALALDCSLLSGLPLAACAALSGVLPRLPARRPNPNLPAFFLGHGSQDEILPVELGRAAASALKNLGAKVTYKEYPMAHSISQDEVGDLRAFLSAALHLA